MLITADRIFALCSNARPEIVTAAAQALEANRARFGVSTPERVVGLIPQIAVESAGFRFVSDGSTVYAGYVQ